MRFHARIYALVSMPMLLVSHVPCEFSSLQHPFVASVVCLLFLNLVQIPLVGFVFQLWPLYIPGLIRTTSQQFENIVIVIF
jgi:hypothetical protein